MCVHIRLHVCVPKSKYFKKLCCTLIHIVYHQWKFSLCSQKGMCVCLGVCVYERERKSKRDRRREGERVHQELSMHKEIKREYFSRAIEAHLLNNDDSSSFSTTIEGT